MKRAFCLTAALAALCAVVFNIGKTDARNMWEDVKVNEDDWELRGKAIYAARDKQYGKLKIRYDSLKNDYLKKTLGQDLSKLSMNDLLTLRSGVYAVNGLLITDNNLYSRFMSDNGPIPWYADYMCYLQELMNRSKGKGYATAEKDVLLNAAEKAFVGKIDGRLAELRQNGMYVNKNGYTIGDIAHVVNMGAVKTLDKNYTEKLAQNNFVIVDNNSYEQLFHLYEQNNYIAMPSFVTTDLFLQAFHMYFSYALKTLEEKNFIPALEDLTFGLYKASMELSGSKDKEISQIAEYSAVFYAVPYSLLTGKKLKVAARYQEGYVKEVTMSKEAKADGEISKFLSDGDGDPSNVVMHYSLFKPRGHYTRKPKMEAYFRAMMWLQKAYACREKTAQLKQSVFMAALLNTAKSSKGKLLADVYASIFEPTALLVGEPNNLSTMDIAKFLKKEGVKDAAAALSDENVKKVDLMLAALSERIVIKPKLLLSCHDKINFMPQRYLIDNEVLMEMVDTSLNAQRAFPKGLDVFAAFGSAPAADALNNVHKEKAKWAGYPSEMDKLQKKFKDFNGWNKSVYNKWLEALLALQKDDKSYPAFMNTKAWGYKNLNTSLASWAELKHDFILYADQPMAAESGGGCDGYSLPSPDIEVGYVEPNILFWNKLDELVKLTINTLAKHNLLNSDLKGKSAEMQKFIAFLTGASKKELAKKPLSAEEYGTIRDIGGAVERFTLTVIDPEESPPNWSYVSGPDRSIAAVADVYTRNMPDCPKNGILHVATGNANEIYVVVEINGYLYLTRGATFSYHEFVMPEGVRLTDEEWQAAGSGRSKQLKAKEWMNHEWMKSISEDKSPRPEAAGGWSGDEGMYCYDDGLC
jgi:hypothetical protein